MSYLLDTNIVFFAIKGNRQILEKIKDIKDQKKAIFISCITYFPPPKIRNPVSDTFATNQETGFLKPHADYLMKISISSSVKPNCLKIIKT